MCIFKKAKKNTEVNKTKFSEAELKFNKMWDLWAEGNIPSPYADLMTYQSEVNNGGHAQFFDNVSGTGHLHAVMKELKKIVPFDIKLSLVEAYNAYKVNGEDAEENESFFDHADEVFYEKEEKINKILEKFSETIQL
jgi:hypothetical protein